MLLLRGSTCCSELTLFPICCVENAPKLARALEFRVNATVPFAEHGIVFAQSGRNAKKLLETCWGALEQVPHHVAQLAHTYMRQIESAEIEIGIMDVKIKCHALKDTESKRLQTMPGVGPQSALAIQAFCPPATIFRTGRDFAVWLGLEPRQHSTGGKQKLGRITKMGQRDVRRLLIIRASSVIAATQKKGRCDDP